MTPFHKQPRYSAENKTCMFCKEKMPNYKVKYCSDLCRRKDKKLSTGNLTLQKK